MSDSRFSTMRNLLATSCPQSAAEIAGVVSAVIAAHQREGGHGSQTSK
jgi:hypothetical protein